MLLSPCDHFESCKESKNRKVNMNLNDVEKKEEKEEDEQHNDKLSDNSRSIDSNNGPNVENKCKEVRQNSDQDKCFLCLKTADYQCKKCLLAYCCEAHYDLHIDSSEDINSEKSETNHCFPFRVLENQEVTGELSQN